MPGPGLPSCEKKREDALSRHPHVRINMYIERKLDPWIMSMTMKTGTPIFSEVRVHGHHALIVRGIVARRP